MEMPLHLAFVAVLIGTIGMSAFYRYRARRNKPGLDRFAESPNVRLFRLVGTLPLLVVLILSCFAPAWLEWAELPLPLWTRWFGVVLGGTGMLALGWVFRSIGDNISETLLTKSDHELVTHGPYQLIRHPLYTFGLMQIFAFGLISSNSLLIAFSILGLIFFRCFVIPREEANLLIAFGHKYTSYQANTWALIPWVT